MLLGPEIVVVEEVVVAVWETVFMRVFVNLVTKHEANVHIRPQLLISIGRIRCVMKLKIS